MDVSLCGFYHHVGATPKMLGFPNNHGGFQIKMISTWGVKWGYHHETSMFHPSFSQFSPPSQATRDHLGGGLESASPKT